MRCGLSRACGLVFRELGFRGLVGQPASVDQGKRVVSRAGHDRGSLSLETILVTPAVLIFLGLILAVGWLAMAQNAVQSAAADAARTASISRSPAQATSAARDTAAAALENRDVQCRRFDVTVASQGFTAAVGVAAEVGVTVSCEVELQGFGGLGAPVLSATVISPLDTYRGRS